MTINPSTAAADRVSQEPAPPSLRLLQAYNGPHGSANGGFACGTFAQLVSGPAAVRLDRKVPLERDFVARRTGDGGFSVHDADQRVASVSHTATFKDQPPIIPTYEAAVAARAAHPLRAVRHPLSDCVVCGPERSDGLHVTPGPLAGMPQVLASPFVVRPEFATNGMASVESVWGALDCVSYPADLLSGGRLAHLGTLAVDIHRSFDIGEELIALGWKVGSGTRSHSTASALVDAASQVVASGRAVWVEAKKLDAQAQQLG